MKRQYEAEGQTENRDRKRDKTGWKAQLKTARKAKAKRKQFEQKGWR